MTERNWDTGYFDDPFIQSIPALAKLLVFYFGNNSHCNSAGLYQITYKTISNETDIEAGELPELLKLLEPKVIWYPEHDIVWVKNFIKRQSKNFNFLIAVAKSLSFINYPEIVNELLDYNFKRYGLEIPVKERSSLSETSPPMSPPPSKESDNDVLIPTAVEIELLEVIKTLPGWQYQEQEDLAWLRALTQDFQNVTVANLKACGDFHSENPRNKGPWKSRIRNWLRRDKEPDKEGKSGAHPRTPRQLRPRGSYTKPEDL